MHSHRGDPYEGTDSRIFRFGAKKELRGGHHQARDDEYCDKDYGRNYDRYYNRDFDSDAQYGYDNWNNYKDRYWEDESIKCDYRSTERDTHWR